MVLKWFAFGLKKYFTDAWCWVDFVCVFVWNIQLLSSESRQTSLMCCYHVNCWLIGIFYSFWLSWFSWHKSPQTHIFTGCLILINFEYFWFCLFKTKASNQPLCQCCSVRRGVPPPTTGKNCCRKMMLFQCSIFSNNFPKNR